MTTTLRPDAPPAPNHHSHHPAFGGLGGLIAAVGFLVGRDGDAELAVRLTRTAAGDDVVDVGCGPGVAARRAAAAGAASVLGVDPSAVMLRVARLVSRLPGRRGGPVRYLDGAAEALPLDDGAASVVWSLASVHHWRDLDGGLAEVFRVLRPGGRFLTVERRCEPGAVGHASHGWTAAQALSFADRCRAAGFTVVAVEEHQAGRRALRTVLLCRPE